MGRKPTLLKPEVREVLLQAIKLGMNNTRACEYAMISYTSLKNWLAQAEIDVSLGLTREKSIYVAFLLDLKKARAQMQYKHLQQIDVASFNTWQASAWLLERRFPEEFGVKNDINLSGDKIAIVADMPKREED